MDGSIDKLLNMIQADFRAVRAHGAQCCLERSDLLLYLGAGQRSSALLSQSK